MEKSIEPNDIRKLFFQFNAASIPGWNIQSDEIICIAELKLGLIGMSCVVPESATMVFSQISPQILLHFSHLSDDKYFSNVVWNSVIEGKSI